MINCRDCQHATSGYGQLLCKERHPTMPADWRRDSRNECKPDAKLFKPLDPNKPEERWIPY